MSTTEKANVVHALSRTCIALARTGIKQRYPNATEYEVRMRLAVLMAGPDLIRAANGWDATLEGL